MHLSSHSVHALRAISIARASGSAPLAKKCARQGDLLLTRVAASATHPDADCPTPEEGLLLVAGRHGEHRAIGCAVLEREAADAVTGDATLHVGHAGVIVVHTDEPAGRHAPLRLGGGTWRVERQQEMGLDAVVRRVKD
jgi:hypothetical protein